MNTEKMISELNLNNDIMVRKQTNATEFARLLCKLGKTFLTVFFFQISYNFCGCLFTEELSEIVDDKQEKYNSLEKFNSKIRSNITELEVIHESQQIEKIHSKQSLKNIKKNVKQTSASVERLKDLDVNNEKFKKQL